MSGQMVARLGKERERTGDRGAVILGWACLMGLRQLPHISARDSDPPAEPGCPRLTPLCPTASLLSSSAVQAGSRKINNALSVSSQGGPLPEEREAIAW